MAIGVGLAVVFGARAMRPVPEPATGSSTPVPVATRDLNPGDVVAAGDVRFERHPIELIPESVASDPLGRTVVASMFIGEVVVDPRLGSTGGLGLAPDERAVAVVRPLAVPPLAAGQLVELVAVVASGPAGAAASRLDAVGRVVAVDAESITVAVPAEVAPLIIEYQAAGSIEIVGTPWIG